MSCHLAPQRIVNVTPTLIITIKIAYCVEGKIRGWLIITVKSCGIIGMVLLCIISTKMCIERSPDSLVLQLVANHVRARSRRCKLKTKTKEQTMFTEHTQPPGANIEARWSNIGLQSLATFCSTLNSHSKLLLRSESLLLIFNPYPWFWETRRAFFGEPDRQLLDLGAPGRAPRTAAGRSNRCVTPASTNLHTNLCERAE